MEGRSERWLAHSVAQKLNEKTGFSWQAERINDTEYGVVSSYQVAKNKFDQNKETQKILKLYASLGIGFKPEIEIDYHNPNYVQVNVKFKDPLVLHSFHQGQLRAEISPAQAAEVVTYLNNVTGYEWKVSKDGKSMSMETTLASKNWEEAQENATQLLQKKLGGIPLPDDIDATERGQRAGFSKITATYSNPLIMQSLLEKSKAPQPKTKPEEIQKFQPIKLAGVSTSIGATTMLLLTGGISPQAAKEMKGIANIQFSNDGMTINIPDREYAKRLAAMLKSKGFDSVEYSDIALQTKFGSYQGSIKIKDPREVKRFVEEICCYDPKYTRDFYKVNGREQFYRDNLETTSSINFKP